MSKGYDIKHSIIQVCKQHGQGLQMAIELNIEIMSDLNWIDYGDIDAQVAENNKVIEMWMAYDKN